MAIFRGVAMPCRVMVVVDDADSRERPSRSLAEGFEVACAEDGRTALSRLRQSAPDDLPDLFLDLMMPVMDGWRLRAELEKDPRLGRIPVVAVTASTERERIRSELEGYLEKPVDPDLLLDTAQPYCPP